MGFNLSHFRTPFSSHGLPGVREDPYKSQNIKTLDGYLHGSGDAASQEAVHSSCMLLTE